eukprot:TRINITY_DN3350_c5_g1_i1.p1 TRINITY_DN3350_c5_g1~~TRINITY_DN3350_c5_g1_i1.p1  ORF type:complete len:369 (+),score=60.76 TRINITY_DN3350_c5_g1_i1:277-1383(+)
MTWHCAAQRIREEYGCIRDMIAGPHLGVGISGGPRRGMYTDDTNSMLALAESLVSKQTLDVSDIATAYVRYWRSSPVRGYPGTAAAALRHIEETGDYHTAATIRFADGSYGNGGAVRIAPIGLVYGHSTLTSTMSQDIDTVMHKAVRLALLPTHVHPMAVDAAWVVAKAVSELRQATSSDLDPAAFLGLLLSVARDPTMQRHIKLLADRFTTSITPTTTTTTTKTTTPKMRVREEWENETDGGDDDDDEAELDEDVEFLIYSFGDHQIMAPDAVACALWCLVSCWHQPEECILKAVNTGGDTDSIGAIAGALAGALHGVDWIPARWLRDLENGPSNGRDFVVGLASRLATLHLNNTGSVPEDDRSSQC